MVGGGQKISFSAKNINKKQNSRHAGRLPTYNRPVTKYIVGIGGIIAPYTDYLV